MPVLLEPANFEQWEQGDPKDAAGLLKPAPKAPYSELLSRPE